MIAEVARIAEILGPIEVGLLTNKTEHFDAAMFEYGRAELRARGLVDEFGLYTPFGKKVRTVVKDMGR